jgi:hypothetical protein
MKRRVPLVVGWQHLAIGAAMQLKFENNQHMKSTAACSVRFHPPMQPGFEAPHHRQAAAKKQPRTRHTIDRGLVTTWGGTARRS